jgi:hypothetical protein
MGTLNGVLTGLLTTLAASMIALVWRTSRHRVTYRRARALWRPFVSGGLKIITGDLTRLYSDLKVFEAGGLVGIGDVQAVVELANFFEKIGFSGFDPSKDVVRGNRPPGEIYSLNLICIGSWDANEATEVFLAKINHALDVDAYKVRDRVQGRSYSRNDSVDYGVLIKTLNPEETSRQVMIIAGCSGYGTWAGAKLACSEQFLRDPLVSKGRPVECLYSTDVINGVPHKPKILVLRELPEGQEPAQAA